MKSQTIANLKAELKILAANLKANKIAYKNAQRSSDSSTQSGLEFTLQNDRYSFRYKHIAYCLVRGRTQQSIEKPNKGNEPNQNDIDDLVGAILLDLQKEQEIAA